MISGVLFDKDGTLIDFRSTWVPAYLGVAADLAEAAGGAGELADELLIRLGFDRRTNHFRDDSPLLWCTNAQIADTWLREPELRGIDVLAVVERHFTDLDRYPPQAVGDLPALLTGLRQRGLCLGIATMDSYRSAHDTAIRLGIGDQFAFMAGSDSGFGTKPEPGMVLAFCEASGLAPSAVAMIGDTPADLEMGRRAGCGLVVGVLTGGASAAVLEPLADHVVPDVMALPGLLSG
ncbi:MAG: HAD family hydrolase [Geminicoccaceae bacterium]